MAEKRAYKILVRQYPNAHWQRFESWTMPGIFDANACLDGVEVWVECKEAKDPKTSRGLIRAKVRKGQVPWEHLRRRAGGRTFIALMVGQAFYLLHGHHLKALKKGVTQMWLVNNNIHYTKLFNTIFIP